jgi:dihydrofolate synthase/folylpolyglutamate synthase
VSAEQKPEALEVLRRAAKERNAPFLYTPDDIAPQAVLSGLPLLNLPVPGKVYERNAALAVTAVHLAFPGIAGASIAEGLRAVSLPARFEKVRDNPPFIVDGAHTPLSIAQCAETFCERYGAGRILLFACAADKDSSAMAEILLPCFNYCLITSIGTFRASDPDAVYRAFTAAAEQRTADEHDNTAEQRAADGHDSAVSVDIRCIPDTAAALAETLCLSREQGLPVLACGSFYLAAEIRKGRE